MVDGGLADLGTGTLRPRLPNERDKEYERNTSAALLLKTRQFAAIGLNPTLPCGVLYFVGAVCCSMLS